MTYSSPFADPLSWSLTVVPIDVPVGLRYEGYSLRGIRATRTGAASVRAPVEAAVRMKPTATHQVLQLEPLPFVTPQVARAFAAGQPTIYLLFALGTAIAATEDQRVDREESLATVDQVDLLLAFPDRVGRMPARWTQEVLDALTAAGQPTTGWQPFHDRVVAQTETPATRPVLLLDSAGQPLQSGSFELELAGATHGVTLEAADGGDLNAAVGALTPHRWFPAAGTQAALEVVFCPPVEAHHHVTVIAQVVIVGATGAAYLLRKLHPGVELQIQRPRFAGSHAVAVGGPLFGRISVHEKPVVSVVGCWEFLQHLSA